MSNLLCAYRPLLQIPQQPRLKDRASRMRQPTAGRVQCRLSDAGTALCVRVWQPGALPWHAPEQHHIGGHVQRKSGCARGHHYPQWSRTSLTICRAFLLGLRVSSLTAATTEPENTVPAALPTLSGANTAFSSPYASAQLTPVSLPRHPAAAQITAIYPADGNISLDRMAWPLVTGRQNRFWPLAEEGITAWTCIGTCAEGCC